MRGIICEAFAPIDALQVGELPMPVPADNALVIEVVAAGLNFYDTLIVQGKYQVKPPLPFTPGGEVAGIVSAIGAAVQHFKVGDRVVAFPRYGGFAQYCTVAENMVFPLPETVSFAVAAASLVAYGTAWFALLDRGAMRSGETVIILGAGGGVGLAAVQIAHLAGARVIAAAGSEEKLALCRAAGADVCVNYNVPAETLKETFKLAVGSRAADIVVDLVGAPYTEAALRALAWRGRLMVIGFASGEIARIPANLILLKGCSVSGVLWDGLLINDAEQARSQTAQFLQAIAEGKLTPNIARRYAVKDTVSAMQSLATRQVAGKIIITP